MQSANWFPYFVCGQRDQTQPHTASAWHSCMPPSAGHQHSVLSETHLSAHQDCWLVLVQPTARPVLPLCLSVPPDDHCMQLLQTIFHTSNTTSCIEKGTITSPLDVTLINLTLNNKLVINSLCAVNYIIKIYHRRYWQPCNIMFQLISVPDMTYNVFRGTLNLTQSIDQVSIDTLSEGIRYKSKVYMFINWNSGNISFPAGRTLSVWQFHKEKDENQSYTHMWLFWY